MVSKAVALREAKKIRSHGRRNARVVKAKFGTNEYLVKTTPKKKRK